MMNFCTLFDSYYIHKGIALYLSLERVCDDDFTLYVMAFDEPSFEKLSSLGFKHMVVEYEGGDFLTDEIKRVKNERKRNEYCWTCGSNITYYFMSKYQTDSMTYVDADMMFFSSPYKVFEELKPYSVGLSSHFADTELYGKFCVQFCYFKNDEKGMKALTWWKDSCLEWCYDRYEDGKFGDQRYLDMMPEKFEGVHEIENRGVGVAKWNMLQYKFLSNHHIVYQGVGYNVCFYHFHAVAVDYKDGNIYIASKKDVIPQTVIDFMFKPYGELLKEVYVKYLDKPVGNVIINNPGLLRQMLQWLKNQVRGNKLVQYLFFKYIKGHTGYNKKQLQR